MAEGDGLFVNNNVVYLSKGRVNLIALRQAIEDGQDIQDFNQYRGVPNIMSIVEYVGDGAEEMTHFTQDILPCLLWNGIDLNQCDNYGQNVLISCSKRKHGLLLMPILLDHGCNINHQDKEGLSALMMACLYGREDMVRFLLQRGAELHLVTNRNDTALTIAGMQNYADIVQVLLENGALQLHIESGTLDQVMTRLRRHYRVMETIENFLQERGLMKNYLQEEQRESFQLSQKTLAMSLGLRQHFKS